MAAIAGNQTAKRNIANVIKLVLHVASSVIAVTVKMTKSLEPSTLLCSKLNALYSSQNFLIQMMSKKEFSEISA